MSKTKSKALSQKPKGRSVVHVGFRENVNVFARECGELKARVTD